jgi:hypothetical protein
MKETEVAKDVINYLSDYDLYYEVMDVDIIAKLDNILTAVEVKVTMNFKVIEQAYNNLIHFHYSYIAVPFGKFRNFQYRICKDYGIGVLELRYNPYNGKLNDINERVKPKFNRHAFTKHIVLTPEDKKSIAGASGKDGTTRTSFKITLEAINEYVSRHEGCTFKELFDNINHHYHNFTSARNATYKWIREGIINTIYVDNGKIYTFKLKANDIK